MRVYNQLYLQTPSQCNVPENHHLMLPFPYAVKFMLLPMHTIPKTSNHIKTAMNASPTTAIVPTEAVTPLEALDFEDVAAAFEVPDAGEVTVGEGPGAITMLVAVELPLPPAVLRAVDVMTGMEDV